ncbi:MAG: ATP-binding protein [Kiritimatiellae bacterium]|nr:ATP-binding protein [Kiritimatiellia bacterium]
MSEFQPVATTFLLRNMARFWMNLVRYLKQDITNQNFFNLVHYQFDRDLAIELVEVAFSEQELDEMKNDRCRFTQLRMDDSINCVYQAIWNHERYRERARVMLETVGKCILANFGTSGPEEQMEKRFGELKRRMKLNDHEYAAMILAYMLEHTYFDWPCGLDITDKPMFYAMALNISLSEMSNKVMVPDGRLRKFNLLDNGWDWNHIVYDSYINGTGNDAVDRRFYRVADLSQTLPWEYFGSLAEWDGELLRRVITPGIGKKHILLYGVPGTGKTSFARALAKQLGFTAYEIKQGDRQNMSNEFRLTGIRVCNECENDPRALMIIDEADELLRSGAGTASGRFDIRNTTEKGLTNNILDESRMPAIWICNSSPNEIDESVRRRFDYSIHFDKLSSEQREFIWRNTVISLGMLDVVDDSKIKLYADKYPTSPGGISMVLTNVKQIGATADDIDELIDRFMKPHCRLMGIQESSSKTEPAKEYSLEGLNIKGKVPLDNLVRAVRNYLDDDFNRDSADRPRMNILLWGPPGTGKTEFVKFLGEQLDRNVLVKFGSDLFNKWVGGTEENIAGAFRQAEIEHSILFFDEIDGIVQDRTHAHQNWEISQVNELLQQMENFDGVMVAATNFSNNLDSAIIRRFTFKLEFDYLDDTGKRIFFERMFKTKLSAAEAEALNAVKNLTPGDFRTVRQSLFYLANQLTNYDRIAALREETLAKKDIPSARTTTIGFAGSPPAA